MAITIKNIPVLEGATAEDFVRSADKNAVKATDRPTTFSPAAILKRLRTLKKLRKSVFITDYICSILPNKIQKLYHNT
mgnify:CR=1 FL=1